MSHNSSGLPTPSVDKIRGILRNHPNVRRAVLYGSRAKGNYKTGSDIDLTLHGGGLTDAELMQIMDELDDLLLPWRIDLSLLHRIGQASLLDHIRRAGVVFYERADLPTVRPN